MENLKHDNTHNLAGGDEIIVIYRAKLNEDVVVGTAGDSFTDLFEKQPVSPAALWQA